MLTGVAAAAVRAGPTRLARTRTVASATAVTRRLRAGCIADPPSGNPGNGRRRLVYKGGGVESFQRRRDSPSYGYVHRCSMARRGTGCHGTSRLQTRDLLKGVEMV